MFRGSYPAPGIGYVIWSDTAPNVVLHPELATFDWNQTSGGVPTGHKFFWNGSSWEEFTTSAQPADGSIGPAKLTPGFPNYVLGTNISGTAVEFRSIATVIAATPIPFDAIPSPQYVLELRSGSVIWSGIKGNGIEDGTIPTSKMKTSGSVGGQVLTIDTTTGQATWKSPVVIPGGPAGGDLSGTYPNPILEPSGVTPGVYGGPNTIPVLTLDAKGRVILASNSTATFATAKLLYEVPKGTIGTLAAGGVLQINNEIDPSGIVVVGTNDFTLGAGTYIVEVYSELHSATAGAESAIIELYNDTAAISVDWATVGRQANNELLRVNLKSVVTLAVPSALYYKLTPSASFNYHSGTNIGANQGTFTERYTTVMITKIA